MKTVCKNCKSEDVEIRAWIHQKTGAISGETGDDEDTWCNNCESHSGIELIIE